MNAQLFVLKEKFDWDEEDELFQLEFSEISNLHSASQNNPPKVPSKLSRLIRQQAKSQPAEDIAKHWVFSKAMMLVLAVLILFSVGWVFAIATEAKSDRKMQIDKELNTELKTDKSELHLEQ